MPPRCGLLVARGALAACGALVDPQAHVSRCVLELCVDGEEGRAPCRALGAYAAACEEAGVALAAWREAAGCAEEPGPPGGSSIKGGHMGRPQVGGGVNVGVDVDMEVSTWRWRTRSQWRWRRRCRCRCGCRTRCRSGERCVEAPGGARCAPSKYVTCVATGDPHYTTFDGLRYDFQGTCVYLLAAPCGPGAPAREPFRVTVENHNRGSKAVSFTKSVSLEVYGTVITMSQEHPRKVQVNGTFVELPFAQGDDFRVYASGVHGFVRTRSDLRVTFDWHSYARVIAPRAYAGGLCGLCGDADGDPANDVPGGDPVAFADAWKVADVPGCSAGCAGDCAVCDEARKAPYRGAGLCGLLAGPPFAACHAALDPAPFVEDCAFDVCQYGGHHDMLCAAVAAYVAACQQRGLRLGPWRTPELCSEAQRGRRGGASKTGSRGPVASK
uniref:VWFD domain-containing protein n=1 Tax=Nothoprocta perdicaria TaxID=30464 RepID=A0A8C7E845_NOTPE